MCVTRVGRIITLEGERARVKYLDTLEVSEIDVSFVDARRGSYVEIFAERAIGCITKEEAEFKRSLRLEMMNLAKGAVP